MARFIHYRCPECHGVFRWLCHPSDAPPPDRCQLCNAWVAVNEPPEEVFVAQAPRIRENAYARSIDQVFRSQEAASIERANDAEDMLEGAYAAQAKDAGPFEEQIAHEQKLAIAGMKSGLKITDMKDPSSMREGDTAAVTSTPPGLATAGGQAQFQNLGGVVPNHAPGVGPAGDQSRQMLNQQHGARAHAVAAAGQLAPTFIDRR